MNKNHESFGYLVTDIIRLMRRSFARRLGDSPLTLNEIRALKHVARNQGVRQIDLAEMLEIQPIQLARLIDRLAKLKLVERKVVPEDRRAYHIHLLPAADEVISSFEKVASVVLEDAMKGLSSEQFSAMLESLNHIRNNLNPR
jgi:DNA-binding MarR family transcriptional regulator